MLTPRHVLPLVLLLSAGACIPNVDTQPKIRIRLLAALTCDDAGANCVYDGGTAADLRTNISRWVDQANLSFARSFMPIEVQYDPAADATEVWNTNLNQLPYDASAAYAANGCQEICTAWNGASCRQTMRCTERKPDGSCKTQNNFVEGIPAVPACDQMTRDSYAAADQWVRDNDNLNGVKRAVVFFRHGPGPNKAGGGFSFPDVSHDFTAMPDFYATGVALSRDATTGAWIRQQNIWLFAHEFGHFLGLSHTHAIQANNGGELVDALIDSRGNANVFDGDGLEDTPSDPGPGIMFGHSSDDAVNYCGTPTAEYADASPKGRPFRVFFTADGDITIRSIGLDLREFNMTFHPDKGNVMGYWDCDAVAHFSVDQQQRIYDVLQGMDRRRDIPCGNPDNQDRAFCGTRI